MNSNATLVMGLFDPGMSVLHRAGLGGLACTLKALENDFASGNLDHDQLPGWPWTDTPDGTPSPPWTITAHSVSLDFGRPEGAAEYLKRLFEFAFRTTGEGLVFLPGQHANGTPRNEVLAELQAGLTLTFLQHGKVRGLDKTETTCSYDPEQTGVPEMTITFRKCAWYKHQKGYEDLVTRKGHIRDDPVEVIGPLCPGAVVRHNAFTGDTKIEDVPARILPLYFALVGCMAMPVNRAVGVLLVPDVDDLLTFVASRPIMTPRSAKDCRITSAGDAALQAQVRLKSTHVAADLCAPACYAMTLRPTQWASQQKSRVSTMNIPPGDDDRLQKFELALLRLPPRIAHYTKSEGRGKNKVQRVEFFWADSLIRPLIADNLALDRPWYTGFTRLMTALDSNNRPLRDKLIFEKEGLHAMTEKIQWDSPGEEAIVQAVHEAIRSRYGQIAEENKGKQAAMKNRFKGEYDRWRLAFSGAKTADQLRNALVDLWSRGGTNRVLQEGWRAVLPLLSGPKWQLARDLSLLALASYQGRGGELSDGGESDEPNR